MAAVCTMFSASASQTQRTTLLAYLLHHYRYIEYESKLEELRQHRKAALAEKGKQRTASQQQQFITTLTCRLRTHVRCISGARCKPNPT